MRTERVDERTKGRVDECANETRKFVNSSVRISDVTRALQLSNFDARRAQHRMAPRPRSFYRPPAKPGRPRQSGALLLLYPRNGQLTLALTRRADMLDNHRGQIALPGGRQEPGETLAETAVRETCEELGICLDGSHVLNRLASLYIPPSDFELHPFVAYHPARPDFAPSPAEVSELLEVSLDRLLDPAVHQEEEWTIRGHQVQVPFYYLGEHKVWGATAMVLSEFERRLWAALAPAER